MADSQEEEPVTNHICLELNELSYDQVLQLIYFYTVFQKIFFAKG